MGDKMIGERERKKLNTRIIMIIASWIVIDALLAGSYFSYLDGASVDNLSVEQGRFIQGRAIAELEGESQNKFFIFSSALIVSSFLVVVFLIHLMKKRAKRETIESNVSNLGRGVEVGKVGHGKSKIFEIDGENEKGGKK